LARVLPAPLATVGQHWLVGAAVGLGGLEARGDAAGPVLPEAPADAAGAGLAVGIGGPKPPW